MQRLQWPKKFLITTKDIKTNKHLWTDYGEKYSTAMIESIKQKEQLNKFNNRIKTQMNRFDKMQEENGIN